MVAFHILLFVMTAPHIQSLHQLGAANRIYVPIFGIPFHKWCYIHQPDSTSTIRRQLSYKIYLKFEYILSVNK